MLSIAAAVISASCTFGACTAQITPASLQVICSEKPVYSGAYVLTTDFKSTAIQADAAGGPTITVQGAPASGTQISSTLSVAGQSIPGICGYNAN